MPNFSVLPTPSAKEWLSKKLLRLLTSLCRQLDFIWHGKGCCHLADVGAEYHRVWNKGEDQGVVWASHRSNLRDRSLALAWHNLISPHPTRPWATPSNLRQPCLSRTRILNRSLQGTNSSPHHHLLTILVIVIYFLLKSTMKANHFSSRFPSPKLIPYVWELLWTVCTVLLLNNKCNISWVDIIRQSKMKFVPEIDYYCCIEWAKL